MVKYGGQRFTYHVPVSVDFDAGSLSVDRAAVLFAGESNTGAVGQEQRIVVARPPGAAPLSVARTPEWLTASVEPDEGRCVVRLTIIRPPPEAARDSLVLATMGAETSTSVEVFSNYPKR